ncbi:hypothetical protein J6590_085288 [Homalodisca vitripennis]|nr:hypothetical protein J6590_085288 [Homalodisca vitripennis]
MLRSASRNTSPAASAPTLTLCGHHESHRTIRIKEHQPSRISSNLTLCGRLGHTMKATGQSASRNTSPAASAPTLTVLTLHHKSFADTMKATGQSATEQQADANRSMLKPFFRNPTSQCEELKSKYTRSNLERKTLNFAKFQITNWRMRTAISLPK